MAKLPPEYECLRCDRTREGTPFLIWRFARLLLLPLSPLFPELQKLGTRRCEHCGQPLVQASWQDYKAVEFKPHF